MAVDRVRARVRRGVLPLVRAGLDRLVGTARRLVRGAGEPRRGAALAVLAAAAALTAVRCAGPRRSAAPDVEVLLDRDLSSVEVALPGPYRVLDARGGTLADGARLKSGRLRARDRGLDLNGVPLTAETVLLAPEDDVELAYKGRTYAGDLRVRRDARGRLEVVNVVDVEEYLAGVLFSEMPANFPDEALRAQAVAARTYARYRLEHGEKLLRATDADQVYGGTTRLQERARALVAASRGLVLEVGGEPLCSYFMSTCGGATVDAPLVFTQTPKAGLAGVACDFCRESPKYRWTRTLAAGELARRLGVKEVAAIDVERDKFGHAIRFTVRGSGENRTFQGLDFRRAWNDGAGKEEQLPSPWARQLEVTRGGVRIDGAGFGHGVGLCQYGAAGQAKAGRGWREIIGHYYRGAQLVKRW
ncbi:MAG: SpoIID/LytB domain-containing protein [Planctomycetes bacterium]|nr:SpoIID/LytB domain-containing protein [Planctomycetota bacterium]